MTFEAINETICLQQYISEREYREIKQLEAVCNQKDKVNLKLELEYRLEIPRDAQVGLKIINEFLYYIGDNLVAYLGISNFGGNDSEMNGMTHPDFRRQGLFSKLFELAIGECRKREFNKILLLSDHQSESGIAFIEAVQGYYDFSEYRMVLVNKVDSESISPIILRQSEKRDRGITYMVDLNGADIGTIRIEYGDNSAFLCGFELMPGFRGTGYGKAAFKEALRIINEQNITDVALDVESKNDVALHLYQSCGFVERSVMNYYKYDCCHNGMETFAPKEFY